MEEEVSYGIIKGIGAICTFPFLALMYMAIFRVGRHDAFVDLATGSQRKLSFDDAHLSPYHPRRLWRIIFLVMAWVGGGYIVFGIMYALVGWMSEDWRVWNDTWDGTHLSTVVSVYTAGLSMCFLPIVWEKIVEASRHRRRREDEAYCYARVESLIERILTRPADHDGFSSIYGERLLRTYVEYGMLDSARADELMVMIKIIETVVRETRPDFNFQAWYDANVAFEVGALNLKKFLKSAPMNNSDKARMLVWLVKDREGMALVDDGRELRALLPSAPNGLMPPDILADCHRISTLGSYSKTYSAKEKTARIVEMILWADQAGVIDNVDDYLRNTAKWMFVKTNGKEKVYV